MIFTLCFFLILFAIAALLIYWITGLTACFAIAKFCAAAIVGLIALRLFMAVFKKR